MRADAVNVNTDGSEDIGLMQVNSSELPTLAQFRHWTRATLRRMRERLCGDLDSRPQDSTLWPDLESGWRIQRFVELKSSSSMPTTSTDVFSESPTDHANANHHTD